MSRALLAWWLGFVVVIGGGGHTWSQEQPVDQANPQAAAAEDEPIDFNQARDLLRKRNAGEKLTPPEQAYLERAIAARRGQRGTGAPRPDDARIEPRAQTGLKPLTEMTAEDNYQGEDGGLYGKGENTPPQEHRRAAEKSLAKIEPLDKTGQAAATGNVVFISISMSNATQEFSRFKQLADADQDKSPQLTIVDCAQGGQAMAEWVNPEGNPWRVLEERLNKAGVTDKQVQVVWIKIANKRPTGDLAKHGAQLKRDTLAVIQNAQARFPNLRVAYLSSRSYGGYAANALNPEPYAYESAFVARWLIQDQIQGEKPLNHNADSGANVGEVKAPVLLWGPYLWADGTKPRASDKLAYTREDFGPDGTHPSAQGREKIAKLMLEFYKHNPLAKSWFVK